jgi:hypothetical protein
MMALSTFAASQASAQSLASAAAVAPAALADAAPAAADQGGGAAAADPPIISFFNNVEFSGFVDTYYTYNFNEPPTGALTPLRNFDSEHNQFTLALAEFAMSKPVTADERVGFRLDLDYGPVAGSVNAFEPGDKGVLENIQQAYVSYFAPAGAGLTIDFGKFVTMAGAEVIESKDNWNYSRSLLFALAIPYYHAGARVTYTWPDPSRRTTQTSGVICRTRSSVMR